MERGRDLGRVVKVAGEPPPARGEEERGLARAVGGRVGRDQRDGRLPPHLGPPVRRPKHLPLAVGVVVDPDGGQAGGEQGAGVERAEVARVAREDERGARGQVEQEEVIVLAGARLAAKNDELVVNSRLKY